jgi:hypothetical protein
VFFIFWCLVQTTHFLFGFALLSVSGNFAAALGMDFCRVCLHFLPMVLFTDLFELMGLQGQV